MTSRFRSLSPQLSLALRQCQGRRWLSYVSPSTVRHDGGIWKKGLALGGYDDTNRLASCLVSVLRTGSVVFLRGPVGAGKTAFTRCLIRSLSQDDSVPVTSPTYCLVNSYPIPGSSRIRNIHHMDFYRLTDKSEALSLLKEHLSDQESFAVVEWPELLEDSLIPTLSIELKELVTSENELDSDSEPRIATLISLDREFISNKWKILMDCLNDKRLKLYD